MAASREIPREIEIKLKVPCTYELMAQRLVAAGAQYRREVLETNIFLDSPDGQLIAVRAALRIRHQITSDGQVLPSVVTWKGPRTGQQISNRPSVDFYAQPPEMAELLFVALGYIKTMEFEKRRRSYVFQNCLVELDEMPQFGFFMEIEAPDEAAVAAARHGLALDDLAVVDISYFAMVRDYLRQHPDLGGKLHFPGAASHDSHVL